MMKLLLLFIGFIISMPVFAQEDPDSPKWWTEDEAKIVVGSAKVQVDKMEAMCIALLSKDDMASHPIAAYEAFDYLKKIRSEKSVELMCKILLYKQMVDLYFQPVPDSITYPAVAVLKKVGSPAVSRLLSYIANNKTDAQYRTVATDLLADLLGQDNVVAAIDQTRASFSSLEEEYGNRMKRLSDLKAEFNKRYRKK